ncbi:hypothetical protein AB870_02555 [Pandoraea faecigallinarum]|uniref:O-antigen ligase n=2 Tax=Pandoraea faecigallinarum TaxID=656179 RepID=A0A0H3WP73_9BURK|nr:hypothetical protein AB870_02555 [Pandoraea faecigallinarum]
MGRLSRCELAFFLISVGYVLSLYGHLYRLLLICFVLAIVLTGKLYGWRYQDVAAIRKGVLIVLPLYLYMALSALWTANPRFGVEYAAYAVMSVMPALSLGILLGMQKGLERLPNSFALLILTFLAMAVVNFYQGGDAMLFKDGSIRTVFAIFLCVSTPMLMANWLTGPRFAKWFSAALLLLALYALRESRSVVLLTIPVVAVMLCVYRRKQFLGYMKFAIPVAILAAVLPILIHGSEPHLDLGRLTSDTSFDVGDVPGEFKLPPEKRIDFARRLTTYTALRNLSHAPVFGAGYTSVWQENIQKYAYSLSAHGYIGNIAEIGIVGMTVFLGIVAYATILFRRRVLGSFARMWAGEVPVIETALFFSFAELLVLGFVHQIFESVVFGLLLGLVLGTAWRCDEATLPAQRRAAPGPDVQHD